jgi:hypothetical protein
MKRPVLQYSSGLSRLPQLAYFKIESYSAKATRQQQQQHIHTQSECIEGEAFDMLIIAGMEYLFLDKNAQERFTSSVL